MSGHVHIGALEVFHFMLMLIISGFILRVVAMKTSDSPIGKALAFIY